MPDTFPERVEIGSPVIGAIEACEFAPLSSSATMARVHSLGVCTEQTSYNFMCTPTKYERPTTSNTPGSVLVCELDTNTGP